MGNSIRILVVDDEPDALDLFKDLFTQKNYKVDCVSGGLEALEFIDKEEVDAVLLDIRMPIIDGIETLIKIKEKDLNIPVVMLTAYGYDDNLISKALELGAAGYISKNLPLAQILNTFETLLSALPRKKS